MDLENVINRIEIEDFLSQYARAIDNRDWVLYKKLFTEDAHIDYSSSGGPVGNLEDIVTFLKSAMSMFEMSQHLISNIETSINENTADVRALFNNPMKLKGGEVWFVGGKYNHKLIKTKDGWKSSRLIEETLWFDRSPIAEQH